MKVVNVITKEIIPEKIQNGILEIKNNGEKGLKAFLKERICGTKNLWDQMKKIKIENWKDNCKTVKVGGKEVNMKAANSLFASLLLVARSAREDVNLPAAIGLHAFFKYK